MKAQQARREPRRRVDGVILVDKPAGIGSNAVLQHVKRLYAAERAGHTGTLDPMASGLLILCLGQATKFAGELLDSRKGYRAEVTLGVVTTTGDREGPEISRRPVLVDDRQLDAALASLRGEIEQIPPMYSALKRDGRPLYEYARQGQTVERAPRRVCIHELILLARAGDRLELQVSCSKGTYIRTLAEDLGALLGCGAHLSGLVRTEVGGFPLTQAHSVETLARASSADRDGLLVPVDRVLARYPSLNLDEDAARRFRQGQTQPTVAADPGLCRIYGPDGVFTGTGWVEAGQLKPKRLLSQEVAAASPAT